MKNFYISKALFSFGGSALSLFLPLFLFYKQVPLFDIFVFYAIMNVAHSLMVMPVVKTIHRFGIIPIFTIGVILHVITYSLIRIIDVHDPLSFYFVSCLFGLSGAFYYSGYHFILVLRQSKGMQLSNLKNISSAVNIVGPVTGSIIVTYFSFSTMYAVFAMLMMLAIIPLVGEKNLLLGENPTWKDVAKEFKLGDTLALGVGFPCEEGTENMIWPLFMGTVGAMSILTIGTTYTSISLAMIVITRCIGWFIDRNDERALVISTVGISVMNVLRCFKYVSIFSYGAITFVGEIFSTTVNSSIDHLCYKRARDGNKVAYIIFREITINAGNVVLYLTCAFVQSFQAMFVIAAIGSLSYILFLRKKS